MRVILLWLLVVIGIGDFFAMLSTLWHHQAHVSLPTPSKAFAEFAWATVPWLVVAACAFPAIAALCERRL